MAYGTKDIRNLALLGHAGAGKTLLTEAILFRGGALRAMGELARGTTVSDHDPLAKELGHSLDVAVCHLDVSGKHLNVLDTPGSPDLQGRSLAVLPAVETAAVVVSALSGVEMGTRRAMDAAIKRGLDRVIIVNKIDGTGNLPALLESIREAFGPECLPVNLPAGGGARVVDCFFSKSGPPTDFSSVADAHRAIIEQVVEVDEALLEPYLAGEENVTPAQLHDAFEKALREGHLIPVLFTSATTGAGVQELIDFAVKLLPDPTEANPPAFVKGEGDAVTQVAVTPDPARHVVAHVFKVNVDPYVGRIGVFRIHQGTVKPGQQLLVGDARKPVKVQHLFKLQGKTTTEIPMGVPGDICALTKVEELHFDAVLHDSHDEDHHHLKPLKTPPAMLGLAISPAKHGDEQKLADALHKVMAEDPTLRMEHEVSTNETVLYGTGELHHRVVLERMRRQFGIEVSTRPPTVPYRETILGKAEGHHRHKKQTGGAGQFGEVYLRVEPLPRGAGFEFVDDVVGGAIPNVFIPAVEKGVRRVLSEGAVAGFPLQDVRVIVYDGKTHAVDGKEVAFVSAGRKAFLEAIEKAQPVILEPIVKLTITSPSTFIGAITGDLTSVRGRILNQNVRADGMAEIEAEAPLSEVRGYQHKLKAITSGAGMYTLEFSHHEAAPPKIQQELAAEWQKKRKPDAD